MHQLKRYGFQLMAKYIFSDHHTMEGSIYNTFPTPTQKTFDNEYLDVTFNKRGIPQELKPATAYDYFN